MANAGVVAVEAQAAAPSRRVTADTGSNLSPDLERPSGWVGRMERIHNNLVITRRTLFRKPGDCLPPALAEVSKSTSQAEQHLLHRNRLRCCPMLEDKQPIWDFL